MASLFIGLGVALPVIFIWQFVATLLMRLFGVRLPFSLFGKNRKRALQLLTFSQSVWEGILSYGCGIFIWMILFEYLTCKYGDHPCMVFSLRICVYAVLWPAVGAFVGAQHWSENRTRRIAPGSLEIGKVDRTPP